jgi:hypothetical protein
MFRFGKALLISSFLFFGSFSSSPNYALHNYSIGGAGTNSASSSTYSLQGTLGEQTNNSTAGSTYTDKNSSIQAEQINVPTAPTLTAVAGTYSELNCIVNTAGNPADTTYAIAVSTTSGFTSTSYVQASTGTLVSTPDYETYSTWNSSSGINIAGLLGSTTYYAKVAAKQGMFTNTEYGAAASATTGTPTLSFSVSPSSLSFGSFLPTTINTSSNINFTFATNATSGGSIYVKGVNNGLFSSSQGFTIPATTGNLSSLSQGFGLQYLSTGQTSGGPLTSVSPYNGTGNNVGTESTTFAQMFTTTGSIVGGTATADAQVKAAGTTPPASDYGETLTFIASASF